MYDIRQFRPALYLLVFVGLCGFAAAAGTPGLWLVAVTLWGANVLLAVKGRLKPIPRVLANLATLAAGTYVVLRLTGEGPPILAIGQFLVVLQLIKLYEQRANRDAGQLVVLSLLLMVAAAISTPELWFGLLLIGYLFLSLYCCLLFHLKVETDSAKKLMGLRDDRPGDLRRLRQDQRRLNSSMRRLTGVVSLAAVASAVVVFLLFPRGSGAGFLSGPQFKTGQAVTGFSGQVGFQDIARITQNTTPVAYVEVLRDGRPADGSETLYLRGNTLDVYVSDPDAPDRWTWRGSSPDPQGVGGPGVVEVGPRRPRAGGTVLEQRFEVEPVGIDVLLALPGVFQVSTDGVRGLTYHPDDGTLGLSDRGVRRRLRYTVWSTGVPTGPLGVGSAGEPDEEREAGSNAGDKLSPGEAVAADLARLRPTLDRLDSMRRATLATLAARARGETPPPPAGPAALAARQGLRLGMSLDPALLRRVAADDPYGTSEAGDGAAEIEMAMRRAARLIDRAGDSVRAKPVYPASPAVVDFALDPAVSGADAGGESLARQRLAQVGVGPLDERIARNMERYLRQNYRYSLDVTDARRSADQDPIDWFVGDDGRRGHCEYFAGTLAVACQALGIPARVAVGFKSDEYNPSMGRYVVRQSHAHAWVEVLTPRGWVTLDPTSGNGDDAGRAGEGPLRRVRQWLEFLQYNWANNVVAYDNDTRENLLQNLETNMVKGGRGGSGLWDEFQAWLERQNLYIYSVQVMAWLIVIAVAVLCGAVLWFLAEKWRLRRRARRMGLRDLPPGEARRLARQLVFYEDLLRLLGRHGHERGSSQTPREFARSLSTLPREAFESVGGLTEVFYRVRYGQGRLTPRRQRLLGRSLESLADSLDRG